MSEADPDLGATGAAYPLWRAKQAIEQGEKTMASQIATLAVHETRATSLLQWLSAEALGVVALLGTHHTRPWLVVGMPTLVAIGIAAVLTVRCFRPKAPILVGINPNWLLGDWPEPCELTTLEEIARRHAASVTENEAILAATARLVRQAWAGFFAVPVVAVTVMVIVLALKA